IRRRHTISKRDWSSDVCSSVLDDSVLLFSTLERRNHHFKNVFMEAACFFHLPFFFKKTSKTIHICFLVLQSLAKRDFIIFYYIWCLINIYHLYIVFQS